ncbi:MAG: hypothetical protein ABDH59_05810 [Fervidobacterium sp.]
MSNDVKEKTFVVVILITLCLALGLVGIFASYVPIKVVASFGAIVCIGFLLKHYTKSMLGFIVLATLIFLIPAAGVTLVEQSMKNGRTNFVTEFIESIAKDWKFPTRGMYYKFDSEMAAPRDLKINIKGEVIISFVDTAKVKYPKILSVKKIGDSVEIYGGDKKSTYVFEIGNRNVERLQVNGVHLRALGKISALSLLFSAVSVEMNGEFIAKEINVDGTNIEFEGKLSSEKLSLDSVGMKLKGSCYADDVKISGVGIELNLRVSDCTNFDISGTAVNGVLVYLGERDFKLNVEGVGGVLEFKNLSKNSVDVQSNGVKVVRK